VAWQPKYKNSYFDRYNNVHHNQLDSKQSQIKFKLAASLGEHPAAHHAAGNSWVHVFCSKVAREPELIFLLANVIPVNN